MKMGRSIGVKDLESWKYIRLRDKGLVQDTLVLFHVLHYCKNTVWFSTIICGDVRWIDMYQKQVNLGSYTKFLIWPYVGLTFSKRENQAEF